MININSRALAFDILMEIAKDEAYSNVAVKRVLKRNGAMSRQDKAFITEIVNGTLRNIYYIDNAISAVSKTDITKIKPFILALLRASGYQILFMDKSPDFAVVYEAVKIVKGRNMEGLSGFVNGVLRELIVIRNKIPLPKEGTSEYLSIKYSHPIWIVNMWIAQYGYETTEIICKANNNAPKVTAAVNTLKINKHELIEKLKEEGMEVCPAEYNDDAIYISKTNDITNSQSFNEGLFHIQDESSIIAAKAMSPFIGSRILDICAAPGGKSYIMAQLMENTGEIVSRDIHEHKLEILMYGAKRLGIDIINPELMDATELYKKDIELYDGVLVDAPCSGLGLLSKKPDIRLKKSGNDIDALWPLQRKILSNAAKYVKPGGTLVYSTCTICKKENIKNMEWFLVNFDFKPDSLDDYIPQKLHSNTTQNGWLQLLPGIHNTDGFFIARFKRKGNLY